MEMQAAELINLLKLVHEIFPVPDFQKFQGTHVVLLNNIDGIDNVVIDVWIMHRGELKSLPIGFGPDDVINREELLKVKEYVETNPDLTERVFL